MTAVVSVFTKRAGGYGKSAAKRDYYSLGVFFSWIQSCGETFPGFRQNLWANYKAISVDEWESVLHTWRDEFVNGKNEKSESTRAQVVRVVNVFIDAWACAKILKPVSRLAPVKDANKKIKPKKCLAEVFNSLTRRNIEESDPIQETSSRFPAEEVTQNGRKDIAAALAKINEQRLGDLRRCAEEELKVWHNHFKEGERLLLLCDMPFGEIRRIVHTKYRNTNAKLQAIRTLFPNKTPDLAVSRYLTYVLHEHGGLIPANSTKKKTSNFHADFCRINRSKVANLRAYLTPHPHATNAVQVIFLIDTGANVSVCHSLERNCISESDLPNHKSIAGSKDRARGKLIVSELPTNDPAYQISCVQALEWYQQMSQRISDRAPRLLRNKLFLRHYLRGGVVTTFSPNKSNKQFKLFLSRHAEFHGLDLTADMIRPTVLFQSIHKNDGNLIGANVLADHSTLSTTSAYANKPSLRLIYDELIREFQSLFQTVSISNIDGAAQKIGMASPQFNKRLKRALRTGLGVACLNPKAGYQPGTLKGKNCASLENCPRCPLRFVVASVPNITDLILFFRHLRMSRPEFEATRPQRWLETWLPWLVFADVALEKIQRGPTAAVFLSAKAAADARILAGSVNFPPLS